MPAQPLRRLIGDSTAFKALRERTQGLQALQQVYVHCIPAEFAALTKASRVGYIKAGTVYVLADNAATAAKLRHLLPPLVPFFSKVEAKVTGIRVLSQAKMPYGTGLGTPVKKTLPIDSIELFEKLAQTVHDPALKSALANLAKNSRKSGV